MKIETSKSAYTINLDWLELIAIGGISILETDIRMGRVQENYIFSENLILTQTNKHEHTGFYYCFNIILNEEKVGYLFYGSNGKFRYANPDSNIIHIENHVLYQTGLSQKLKLILDTLQLSFSHYCRLDIAIDGSGLIEKHNSLVNSKLFFRKQKALMQSVNDEKTKQHTGYTIGSRKSEKYIIIYGKTQEINKSNKVYITEFWQKNNLYISQKVDRVELRLFSKALKNFCSDFSCLESTDYLANFFQRSSGRYLEFTNLKNKNRSKSLINWEFFKKIEIKKLHETKKADSLHCCKIVLKYLYIEFAKTNNAAIPPVFLSISNMYNLNNWVTKNTYRWDKIIKHEGYASSTAALELKGINQQRFQNNN